MESCLRIVLLLFLVSGTLTQEGFDLSDALGDPDPTLAPPEKPKIEEPVKPKKPSGDDFGLDLEDALKPDKPEPEKPKKPTSGGGGGDFELDLEDALGPDPKTTRAPSKPVKPNAGGGGGSFDDSDLFDVSGGDYKPDGGRHKPDGGSGHDSQSDADQPQDPDLLWGQILEMLNANMPEEFFIWMSNLRQMLEPLIERAMDLLQAIP